jgi:hypothetical protein
VRPASAASTASTHALAGRGDRPDGSGRALGERANRTTPRARM